jgi:hypothetical protein
MREQCNRPPMVKANPTSGSTRSANGQIEGSADGKEECDNREVRQK